jgi:hypothetical protein
MFFLWFFFCRFVLLRFWAFRNKGSSKARKKTSGLITKNVRFFPPFFFSLPRLFCSISLSRFWAFRNKGGKKTRFQNRQRKSVAAKKSTYSRRLILFYGPPCGGLFAFFPNRNHKDKEGNKGTKALVYLKPFLL